MSSRSAVRQDSLARRGDRPVALAGPVNATPFTRADRVGAGTDPAVTTSYDPANRPLADSLGGVYASDADGRLTARPDAAGSPDQRLEWDSLGRLVRVRPPTGNSTLAAYTYDPLDRYDLDGERRTAYRLLLPATRSWTDEGP